MRLFVLIAAFALSGFAQYSKQEYATGWLMSVERVNNRYEYQIQHWWDVFTAQSRDRIDVEPRTKVRFRINGRNL